MGNGLGSKLVERGQPMSSLKELAFELHQQEQSLLEKYDQVLRATSGGTEQQLAQEIWKAQNFQLSILELIEKDLVPEKFLSFGTITAEDVNVRSGPSAKQEKIHVLQQNVRVIVMEFEGNWAHIQMPDGRTGWVFKDYVRTDL